MNNVGSVLIFSVYLKEIYIYIYIYTYKYIYLFSQIEIYIYTHSIDQDKHSQHSRKFLSASSQ